MSGSLVATLLVIAMLGCGSGAGDGDLPAPTPTVEPTTIAPPTPTVEPTPTASALPRLFVLAEADPATLNPPRLLSSDDLGATWQVRTPSVFYHMVAFAFVDRDHGVAVGGPLARRTSDGGRTWTTQLGDEPDENLSLADVAIDASGTAVVFGNLRGGFAMPGYESWRLPADGSAPQPGIVGPGGSAPIVSMCLTADGAGVAAGRSIRSIMTILSFNTAFITADRGGGWTLGPPDVNNELGPLFGAGWSGTACVGANDLWLVGTIIPTVIPKIFHSADGGVTWTDQSNFDEMGMGILLVDVAFVDERAGWVTGADNDTRAPLIGHTEDGGEHWTWQNVPPNVDAQLQDIAFFDAKLGVVGAVLSGSGPFVLITEDGGSNGRRVDLPSDLRDVLRVGFAR